MKWFNSRYWIFLPLFIVVLLKVLVHSKFTMIYTDDDQMINWLSAVDKSEGRFHSIYFYGQQYNMSFESLLGALLLKLGISVEVAMPLVGSILSMIPFLVVFALFFRKEDTSLIWIGAAMLCLLPNEYHMISSMVRGFFGAIGLASIGLALLTLKPERWKLIGLILCVLSYYANPNSILLTLPVLAYCVTTASGLFDKLKNPLTLTKWAFALFGSIFLFQPPNANSIQFVHKLWAMNWGIEFLLDNVSHIGERWQFITPIWNNGVLFIVILGACILKSFRHNRLLGYLTLSVFIFVLVSLGLEKTTDGTANVFFPYERMYLALPLVISLLPRVQGIILKPAYKFMLMVVALIGLGQSVSSIEPDVLTHVQENSGKVGVKKISELCVQCEEINTLVDEFNADVTVFHSKADMFNYGCKALIPSLKTIHPAYERRYWTFKELGFDAHDRLLFFDWSLSFENSLIYHTGRLSHLKNVPYPVYLLEENNMRLVDLYVINKLSLRPYEE